MVRGTIVSYMVRLILSNGYIGRERGSGGVSQTRAGEICQRDLLEWVGHGPTRDRIGLFPIG